MRLFRNFLSLGLIILFFFCAIPFSLAQPADSFFAEVMDDSDEVQFSEQFYRAEVLEVTDKEESERFGIVEQRQLIRVQLLNGDGQGRIIRFDHYINLSNENDTIVVKEGDTVVLVKTMLDGEASYAVYEPYRLTSLLLLAIIFIVLVVFIAGKRGFSSLIGLGITLFILIQWMLPSIVAGQSPLLVGFIGSVAIATITLYLAHGFKKRTTLALISTLVTLFLALVMAVISVNWANLFGLGSEDAAYLSLSGFGQIDLKGLLLAAIVIGTLGVLDDITTTQTTAVHEIHKTNPKLPFKELYKRSFSVGREHIFSMVNTLVLAYVGASFPIFLLITRSPQPLWVILNNEFLAEEIVRTLVGSMTLVLAVPISTFLAAYVYSSKKH